MAYIGGGGGEHFARTAREVPFASVPTERITTTFVVGLYVALVVQLPCEFVNDGVGVGDLL
jgi:hypothetical protein